MQVARLVSAAATIAITATLCRAAQREEKPRYADPNKVDRDYALQGEYVGEVTPPDGEPRKIGVQVVALGDRKFLAVGYGGGLPGAGWDGEEKHAQEGRRRRGVVQFRGDHSIAELRDGELEIIDKSGATLGKLKRVKRKSPTLGKKPPEGAVVLFNGTSADAFEKGRLTDDGLLKQGTTSKQAFGDHQLHIEFRLPYQPQDRGQGRGNSGVYLQGRYEVQMLDSFGLEGKDNECGGIYTVKAPDVNMCLPPLQWQTYDIDFTAAKYDDGKLTAPPRITVRHNGVLIHDNVKLPADRVTTAAPGEPGPKKGPVYLQDHRNLVRYRNIWVVEK